MGRKDREKEAIWTFSLIYIEKNYNIVHQSKEFKTRENKTKEWHKLMNTNVISYSLTFGAEHLRKKHKLLPTCNC